MKDSKALVIIVMVFGSIAAGIHMFKDTDNRVTVDNAIKQCKTLNVKCFELRDHIPDITVEILGSEVQQVCGDRPLLGCLKGGRHIKLWDDDWQVHDHEFCHAICLPGGHYTTQYDYE